MSPSQDREKGNSDRPLLGEADLVLPDGVSLADWAYEKVNLQNPRIKCFVGCIRLLDTIWESNYAIMHCSPKRLFKIWQQIHKISSVLRDEAALLLKSPSKVPEIEAARVIAVDGLEVLEATLLSRIQTINEEIQGEEIRQLRKLACSAIADLYGYVQENLGRLLAADPRSHYDSDYFLSTSFSRDLDEAQWLYAAVLQLETSLKSIDTQRVTRLAAVAEELEMTCIIPDERTWLPTRTLLKELETGLTPTLREILALPGIRLDELELLDSHVVEIPHLCRKIDDLYDFARSSLQLYENNPSEPGSQPHEARSFAPYLLLIVNRLVKALRDTNDRLCDLTAFILVWRRNISQRRALLLEDNP